MSTMVQTDVIFGGVLRTWRKRRGFSQLDLGLEAGVSSRHISFLETGRAGPSRDMVLRLSATLDLPLRERNNLLFTAGFAPRYLERSLDDADIGEARRALQFILGAHEPNPAFVLDRSWRIVLWNRTQAFMFGELTGRDGSPADLNALDLVFKPGFGREKIVNWEEVAQAVLRRFRRQVARAGPDDPLQETWRQVLEMPGVRELDLVEDASRPPRVLVPIKIRQGDRIYTWFSTLAVFGAAGDITLEELLIESFFPADEPTRDYVEHVFAAAAGGARKSTRTLIRSPTPSPGHRPAAKRVSKSRQVERGRGR